MLTFLRKPMLQDKCVFIDLDGTLLPNPSSEMRFIKYLLREKYISRKQFIHPIWFTLKYGAGLRKAVFAKNKGYLTHLNFKAVQNAAVEFFNTDLAHLLNKKLVHEIKKYQDQHIPTVLLTGAPDFIAEVISQHLKLSDVIATRCSIKNNCFTNHPPIQHPYGIEKASLAQAYCKIKNYSLNKCIAFADSKHDVALLSLMGMAILVNPTKKLGAIAREKNWEIW